jgi:hypothetical protein
MKKTSYSLNFFQNPMTLLKSPCSMSFKSVLLNFFGCLLFGIASLTAHECRESEITGWGVWTNLLEGKMTLDADWLYWNVQQDGINPGTITTINPSITTLVSTKEHVVRPHFKYENGVRVKLAYDLPYNFWDANINYIYFPGKAQTRPFTAPSILEAFTPNPSSLLTAPATTFDSKWKFYGNQIDIDVGYTSNLYQYLDMRPHIGFRAAWWDQKYHSKSSTVIATVASYNSILARIKEQFQGYGIEGGLWSYLKHHSGLSIVGHLGGSILYSTYKIRGIALTSLVDAGVITSLGREFVSDTIDGATPILDCYAGLDYSNCYYDVLFHFHLGWEQHVFFDTKKYLSSGNLSAQGLTLGLEVGF